MYSWKELALMYKEEANRLCDEMGMISFYQEECLPHSIKNANFIAETACEGARDQIYYIESFENYADRINRPSVKFPTKSRKGFLLNPKNWMERGDYETVLNSCSMMVDPTKQIHAVMDKSALICAMKYLKQKGYAIVENDFYKIRDNVITVIDPKSQREAKVKVVASGMQFSGRTKRFGEDGDDFEVEKQYTYLIDPTESVKNIYIFANYDNQGKSVVLYALVKGKYLQDMLVDPLRERFIGRKACILQSRSYNKSDESPFSINELLRRS